MSSFVNLKPYGIAAIKEMSGGIGIIDMERSYTPDKAYLILASLGAQGRQAYQTFYFFDFVFPLTYALLLATSIRFLFKKIFKITSRLQVFCLIPILAAFFDYMENLDIMSMLWNYPVKMISTATISNIFTGAKYLLLDASVYLVMFGVAVAFIRTFQNMTNKRKGKRSGHKSI